MLFLHDGYSPSTTPAIISDQVHYVRPDGWQSYCIQLDSVVTLWHDNYTAKLLKVRDRVLFVTIVYSRWWMTCSSTVDASWHYLKLFHHLLQYKAVNPIASKSAVLAFQRHLWCLT